MGITKLVSIAVLLAFLSPSQSAVIEGLEQCILSAVTPVNDIIYKFKTSETGVTYLLADTSGSVALVDPTKGLIKLAKSLLNQLTFGADNTGRILAVLKQLKNDAILNVVKIEFIVLKLGFADSLLPQIIGSVSSLSKTDNIFRPTTPNYPFYRKLHRIIQQGTQRSKLISKAECNFQTAFRRLLKLILAKLLVNVNSVIIHVGPQGILSGEKLQELIEETGCIPQIKNPQCSPETIKYRTIDGTCNNLARPTDGAAETGFNRFLPPLYFDAEGLGEPVGASEDQPDAPLVDNASDIVDAHIVIQSENQPNPDAFSHMFMQHGQFIDHDMTLAPESETGDTCEEVPCNGSPADFVEPCYTIQPTSNRPCIRFIRSAARCPINGFKLTPREQINVNTAYLDASMVYGSSETVANALRLQTPIDYGLLLTSGDNLLPIDNSQLGEPLSLCEDAGSCFLAGDTRVNEQAALAAIHTVWVREHNRIATELRILNPHWDGETIYQETRKIVGALVQQITYEEWLPIAIGRDSLRPYRRYRQDVSAGISNAFATAAFRMGHSLIRARFEYLKSDRQPFPFSPVELKGLFFDNTITQQFGIDGWMVGMVANNSQVMDNEMAIGLTDNLFQRDEIDRIGLNLAALNIQRGRDHGLPFYLDFLTRCGERFPRLYPIDVRGVTTFDQIKALFPPVVFESIKSVYGNNPAIADLWVAGISESARDARRQRRFRRRFRITDPDPILGPTFTCMLIDQFERLRDGDRFFYLNPDRDDNNKYQVFDPAQRQAIQRTTLSSILCKNINIVSISKEAFLLNHPYSCASIDPIDLTPWIEPVTSCDQRPCRNGGICRCITYFGRQFIYCKCPAGFTGKFCQNKA